MRLYHYTNISTLALILKNRNIRLNRLDFMDDIQEKRGSDVKNIGKYMYASCWSYAELESIPMWMMYTNISEGIRISFNNCFLKKYKYSKQEYMKLLPNSRIEMVDGKSPTYTLPLDFLIRNGLSSPQLLAPSILEEIIYTDDITKLEPIIYQENNGYCGINFKEIGRYKNLHWEFQNECRFIINVLPVNMFDDPKELPIKIAKITEEIRNSSDNYNLPDSIFLEIDENEFKNIEIVKSPKLSPGNEILLNQLIKEYCPTADIKESSLFNLI